MRSKIISAVALGITVLGLVRPACAEYAWRGLMLDESRFFFGKQVVKETLDRMHAVGLNVFHWHLTDDQGWRLAIRGCPELTTIGAFRKSSPKVHTENVSDGKPYGPFFYSEEDVREILAYAQARNIRVIPEIELPGHVGALLTAHPEFSCRGTISTNQICHFNVYADVLCVGNDTAIRYLERVFDEVCRIFPDEVVHIGGDECPTKRWVQCPKCQKRMKARGLKTPRELQTWVTRHFVNYLTAKGKRAMAWDEVLDGGGCPTNVIVQTWRSPDLYPKGETEAAAIRAARLGHEVVLSPMAFTYFSLPAGPDDPGEYRRPVSEYTSYVTPEKVRMFRPDAGFPEALKGRILGAECCCWSEGTRTGAILHQKTWPRAAIFAAALSGSTVEGMDSGVSPHEGRSLVWHDEFDGTELDASKWTFRKSMSSSDCIYTNDARTVRVENGNLHMKVLPSGIPAKPQMLPYGIATHETMAFKYGYLEMRACVPFRHGAWPSFWMTAVKRYQQASWTSEVDIFEVFSSTNALAPNLHKWGRNPKTMKSEHVMLPGGEGKGFRQYIFKKASKLNAEYHVYGFEWTKSEMSFFVDGEKYFSVPIDEGHDYSPQCLPGMAGHHDFHGIIFNNEIFTPGHGWCPSKFQICAEDQLPIDYKIDWVRLYQKKGEEIRYLRQNVTE